MTSISHLLPPARYRHLDLSLREPLLHLLQSLHAHLPNTPQVQSDLLEDYLNAD